MPSWFLSKSHHSKVFALAFPMVLSNITVPLLGLVDTAVIGHLSQAYYLAGVAVGSMIATLVFWMLGFLRMSTTGLVAQARGAQDSDTIKLLLGQALAIAWLMAVVLLLLRGVIIDVGLMLAGGSDEVQQYARQYFEIRIWSAPAALANMAILGWLLGMQSAKAPMILLIVTNLLNIVLDIVFVFGFGWQVQGVAAASVVADYLGLGLGLLFVSHLIRPYWSAGDWHKLKSQILDKVNLIRFMALNRDIFLRTLCIQLCFAFMTFQGARLGDNTLAANAILLNFLLFISFGMDGLAYAVEALVGKSVGAKDRNGFNAYIGISFFWALLLGLILTLLFAVAGHGIVNLISDIPGIREMAYIYLPWLVIIPLTSLWGFILDGIFIGAARAKEMRNSMIVSSLLVFFPVYFMFSEQGNHALWLAMNLFMLARGISLGYLFLRLNKCNGFIAG